MKECIQTRQWLYRALRTALQAAAGVVAAVMNMEPRCEETDTEE